MKNYNNIYKLISFCVKRDLETIATNLVDDYDPALVGVLAAFAVAEVAAVGFLLYSIARESYSNHKMRKVNKNSTKEEYSQNTFSGGYSI